MKRPKKAFLKSLNNKSYKWNQTPIEMYEHCEYYNDESIYVDTKDLKKLLDIMISMYKNKTNHIKNLEKELYGI